MSTTDVNGGVSKAAVEAAVREAWIQAGFTQPDGTRDLIKFRELVLSVLKDAKVLNRQERGDKAVTRGSLMAQVFPGIPGPDSWTGALEQMVWEDLNRAVWAETSPNANKPLQRMVGIAFGNGYVLCRTRISPDRTEAAYITDDYQCIEADYVQPDNRRVERALANATANREMLVLRQPENAKRYVTRYKSVFQTMLAAGNSQMQLALQAATMSAAEESADESESEEGGEE